MASLESELQEEKPGGFTFTWSIHNFSHCAVIEDKCIESPEFAIESFGGTIWKLRLYPKILGNKTRYFLGCFLRRVGHSKFCNFTFSFRKSNGTFEKKYKGVLHERNLSEGSRRLFSHEELNEPGAYLENDTLTISCQIWNESPDVPGSENCYAHTNIKVSKLDYLWNLKDIAVPNNAEYKFKQTAEIPIFISGIPKLKMHVLNEGSLGEDAIHFGIEMPEQENDVFLVTVTHILDEDGKVLHSARGEHFFECENRNKIWDFTIISKRKLYLNERMYMPNGEITLRCELSFSGDPEVISVAYGKNDTPKPKNMSPHLSTNGYELWKENLKQFFILGEMSDLVVRTPNKDYAVHRVILSAQSEVFRTMLKTDMKEKNTGIIEIKDLEDDTVTKMLSYLYTNIIEDLDSSAAQNLYYAADRYRVKALLKICSDHLVCNLDISNVCEILLLADTHHDQELKSCAKDFLEAHVHEIIDSENWKSLMETNSSLILEIQQWLLCNKFLKVK